MKTIILAFLLLIVQISFAQRITIEEGATVATRFLQTQGYNLTANQDNYINTGSVITEKVNDINIYYTYILQPEGYITVSAVKNVIPVLAYSPNGIFDPNNTPENYSFWMKMYSQQIQEAIANKLPPSQEIQQQWDNYLSDKKIIVKQNRSIEPMLTSTWNQGKYYNTLCPADDGGPDGKCYAGCVAAAMGQLMFYYRWPETGSGSYSYIHPTYGELSVDYENTSYQWDAMEDNLSDYNLAIAKLLFNAGVGVDMNYGPNGSGMTNHSADRVLRDYFRYCPETDYIFKDSTNLTWDSILIANLNHKRPLYYAGWVSDSLVNISGHAFVCDGYETEEYFHFNWGWGGQSDGYFYIDDINPGSNFNFGQEVITNIYPDTLNNDYPPVQSSINEINYIKGTLTDGSGPLPYLPNTTTEWLLNPEDENYDSITNIKITIPQISITENDSWLKVYDGINSSAPLLGEYTGSAIPEEVTTSGNKAFIQFISGDQTPGAGWKLRFESSLPVYCGGLTALNEESGDLSDGSFEKLYVGNDMCRWWIKNVGEWDNVFLTFDYIDLADEGDQIQILDPSINPPPVILTFQGPLHLTDYTVIGENNQLYILFLTNGIYNSDGFEAHFQRSMVSIQEFNLDQISIFPIPVKNTLSITFNMVPEQQLTCDIISTTGKLTTFNIPSGEQIANIDVSNFVSGIYFLKLYNRQFTMTKKIIIQH